MLPKGDEVHKDDRFEKKNLKRHHYVIRGNKKALFGQNVDAGLDVKVKDRRKSSAVTRVFPRDKTIQ